jgi:hypothetical protein
MKDIEEYILVAQQHGEDSEPDHEVGDLQDLLRAAWAMMTPEQQAALMQSDPVTALAELTA